MKVIFSASFFAGLIALSSLSVCAQVPESAPDFVAPQITTVPRVTPPPESQKSGLGGNVRVLLSVDESGNVSSVDNVTGPGYVCRQVTREDVVAMRAAAKDAAMQAKFAPATRKGKPVASTMWLNFNFPGTEERTEYNVTGEKKPELKEPDKYTVKGDINFSSATVAPPDYRGPVTPAPQAPGVRPAAGFGSGIPKQINGGVLNGKATSLSKPSYPPAARAVRASGAVSVQVLIDENGGVFSAIAVSGHPLLRSASTVAACGSRFSPTQLSGNPVKVSGIITYNFVP
jgi:outer membrane biosynthesis protein TonB